jgi:hypothetical protein
MPRVVGCHLSYGYVLPEESVATVCRVFIECDFGGPLSAYCSTDLAQFRLQKL